MDSAYFCSPKPRFLKVKMNEDEQRSFSREYKKRTDFSSLFNKPTTTRPQTVDSKIEGNRAIRSCSKNRKSMSLVDDNDDKIEQDVHLLDFLFQLKTRQDNRYKSRIFKLHEQKTSIWKKHKFPELFKATKRNDTSFELMNFFDNKQQIIKNYK